MERYEEKLKHALINHRDFLKDGEKQNVSAVASNEKPKIHYSVPFYDDDVKKYKRLECSTNIFVNSSINGEGPTIRYSVEFIADIVWDGNNFEIKINNPIVLRLK